MPSTGTQGLYRPETKRSSSGCRRVELPPSAAASVTRSQRAPPVGVAVPLPGHMLMFFDIDKIDIDIFGFINCKG
jgi:hypothetical protein